MKDYDLLNPGIDQLAQTTRVNVAKLISNVKNETNPAGDVAAFLLDAAQKTPGYVAPAPSLPATQVIVSHNQNANVRNSAGAVVGAVGKAQVASGSFNGVTLPATTAAVVSGTQTINGKSVTFTVAGGVITDVVIA